MAVVVAATAATVWYRNRESERQHETERKRMEYTERMVEEADRDRSIEGQLETESDE